MHTDIRTISILRNQARAWFKNMKYVHNYVVIKAQMNIQLFGKYSYSKTFEYNFRYSNIHFKVNIANDQCVQEVALQCLIKHK